MALWQGVAPPAADLLSQQPFCCDTLTFPQWLQWILLPRMHAIVERAGPYPSRCGIYVYAEEWALHHCEDCLALLKLIRRFDALIEGRTPDVRH